MDGGASCKAPSGQDQWSPFGLSATSVALLALPLGLIPFFVLFGIPALWQALGSVGGTYLRNKTDGRRAQLLEVMAEDEKSHLSNGKAKGEPEEEVEKGKKDIWKKIESSIQGKLPKGDKADKEWSGIVGFFHPFWYQPLVPRPVGRFRAHADVLQ